MRNQRSVVSGLGVLVLLLAAAPAPAHHSPIAFNTRVTDFKLTGKIDYVSVRDPHSVMDLRAANDDGSRPSGISSSAA